MAIDVLQTVEIIEMLENFVDQLRPADEEIRKKLDFGYNIENQSVILFEIRPDWIDPGIIRQHPFAKATYVKASNSWKIYWLQGNGKWSPYDAAPTAKSLKVFLEIVKKDDHSCFFG